MTGVVVVHPRGHPAYEAAIAAQDAGLLQRYVTTIYRAGPPLPLPRQLRDRLDRELRRRWHPELAPELVATRPLGQALVQAARRALPLPDAVRVELEHAAIRAFGRAAARRLARGPRAGLVHAYEGGALEVLRAARRAGCPTVLDVQSLHERYLRVDAEEARRWGVPARRLPAGIGRRIAREREEADVLLVPSREARAALVAAGVPAGRVVVLPYGADPVLFRPPAARRSGGFRAVCVGNVTCRKGIGHLLEAWTRLALPDAELLVVGNPDGAGRALLARYPGACRALLGVPYGELPDILARADLLVCPSLSDAGPLVVYEAMAAGLPVVTTERARAAVRHGTDGIVVPAGDADALAAAIARLHGRPDERLRMGRDARRRIEGGFTWRHYRARLATVYRHVLEGRRAPVPVAWELP